MSDIDQVYSQELSADGAANDAYEGKPALSASASHLVAHQFPPGVSGNPGGGNTPQRYTLTRALREELTIAEAKEIARNTIAEAKGGQGSARAREFIRDSVEGKPGVRIQDGEWNPEVSPQFLIMQQFAERYAASAGYFVVEQQERGDSPA